MLNNFDNDSSKLRFKMRSYLTTTLSMNINKKTKIQTLLNIMVAYQNLKILEDNINITPNF